MKTGRWAEPSNMQEATGIKLVCSYWLVYSGTDAWRVSEGGRGKRASVERDGKKGRTKAGGRLAFEFPDVSTVIELYR